MQLSREDVRDDLAQHPAELSAEYPKEMFQHGPLFPLLPIESEKIFHILRYCSFHHPAGKHTKEDLLP